MVEERSLAAEVAGLRSGMGCDMPVRTFQSRNPQPWQVPRVLPYRDWRRRVPSVIQGRPRRHSQPWAAPTTG